MQIFKDMADWSHRPFRPDMSLLGWISFIGLILIAIILWQQTIKLILT